MARMNIGRVIAGGLLAGLVVNIGETVLNVVVIAADVESALEARNLPDMTGAGIGVFVTMAFGLGILMVWLYAAIRPRFGPGPRTAVIAGLAIWLLVYVWGGVGDVVMGFMPARVALVATFWGLAEAVLATVAGAWLYREA
jgi:hypothetical protein